MRAKIEMFVAVLLLVGSIWFAWGCATFRPETAGNYTVMVTVVDRATKAPLPGGTVSCNGKTVRVNEKGQATFTNIREGLLKVYTRKTGYWDSGITTYRGSDQNLTVLLTKIERWE